MKRKSLLFVIPILAITVFSSCIEKGPKEEILDEATLLTKYIRDIEKEHNVDTTALGVFYYVREPGGGENIYPEFGDTLTLVYDGFLIDGNLFYSTNLLAEEKRIIVFGEEVNAIEGWNDGLKVIEKDSKVELIIPSTLGFGDKWNTDMNIPPNNTLIYIVEMVNIKKKNN